MTKELELGLELYSELELELSNELEQHELVILSEQQEEHCHIMGSWDKDVGLHQLEICRLDS